MQFTIEDERTIAVIRELSWRLGVSEDEIVKTALEMAATQYVKKPTISLNFIKGKLKKRGVTLGVSTG